MDGGRRPDVVVLAGASVVSLEFKSRADIRQADVDQAAAYARDLSAYHLASHGRPVHAVLVLTSAGNLAKQTEHVTITGPAELSEYLLHFESEGTIDPVTWLAAPYEPLPTLVQAARRLFREEPLPHVRHALSAGIPQALDLLGKLIERAEQSGQRTLAFVTGVPGAGKTLVGLRLVYEQPGNRARAVFLSGNGPLVQVLQDALKSTALVRDLHAFVKTHGLGRRRSTQHIFVFDEAQRMWDCDQVEDRHGQRASEPDLIVRAGERVDAWVALVGLVGTGQEIHTGEEAGLSQWGHAVAAPNATERWILCGPAEVAHAFDPGRVEVHPELSLNATLRSRRAADLHRWVDSVLAGGLPFANHIAQSIITAGFPIYLTRDLDEARQYARARYSGEPDRRYGLIASSHYNVGRHFSIGETLRAGGRFGARIAAWFNRDASDPGSSCALDTIATEFICQGLELDLPIVCWGRDFVYDGRAWIMSPSARRTLRDPKQILTNAYRVLLTRGRDGLVIWVPPVDEMDATEVALLAAGARHLPKAIPLKIGA